ncbi:hypothetical protein PV325_010644 [Microctonus aethiopoides]|nr:hypothetical protein PV325_010644 [Microctonus aethiopoides]
MKTTMIVYGSLQLQWTYGIVEKCTNAFDGGVILTHDGPTVQGGIITFRADLYYKDGTRPSGQYNYKWRDNAIPIHTFETMSNATSIWSVRYPASEYPAGDYNVEVNVIIPIFWPITDNISQHRRFRITSLLNGNMVMIQPNISVNSEYVSSASEAEVKINLREGDENYIKNNATEISTYWFVDCKYYGQTSDYIFHYNFTKPNVTASVEALIVASYEPPTTTPAPTTTTSTTTTTTTISPTPPSNGTTTLNVTTAKPIVMSTTPIKVKTVSTTLRPHAQANNSTTYPIDTKNTSLPHVCINSTFIPSDPNKTYGYFHREVKVRDPIRNITVEGTNWIKPWDMLSLNVTCHGTGPFHKCLEYHRGTYNITGNETCENGDIIQSCNFTITHYFLDSNVYTILMILKNDIGTQIYPLTINIYEVTAKPQLSVIVVPVSCSLAAVVLIVFGIAYYIQSRAKFTVEVADFDFGQNNPEMEYKTFSERLRDSFNSTVSLGYNRIDAKSPYYGSMNR